MPFSAATGLSEAALAAGTASSKQPQATSMQARVNAPTMMANRPGRIFNAPLETGKDMKIYSLRAIIPARRLRGRFRLPGGLQRGETPDAAG
jgi:hypothetical protein